MSCKRVVALLLLTAFPVDGFGFGKNKGPKFGNAKGPKLPDFKKMAAGMHQKGMQQKPGMPSVRPAGASRLAESAASVSIPQGKTSSGVKPSPPPQCEGFDACMTSSGDSESCCLNAKMPRRSCALCLKSACALRADYCSHHHEEKYCKACYEVGKHEANKQGPPPAQPAAKPGSAKSKAHERAQQLFPAGGKPKDTGIPGGHPRFPGGKPAGFKGFSAPKVPDMAKFQKAFKNPFSGFKGGGFKGFKGGMFGGGKKKKAPEL